MHRQPIHSGHLKAVGYDPKARVLEIEFHYGGVYQYGDVPEAVYVELLKTPSCGAYFHAHIKNRYLCHRIQ